MSNGRMLKTIKGCWVVSWVMIEPMVRGAIQTCVGKVGI